MARYIDADKLIGELHSQFLYDGRDRTRVYAKIQEQPTADVAEVVHCKDCKHFNPNEPCVGGTYEACTELSGADGCGMNVEEDFFCAYGEKL